jgi:hypothetical protein
MITAPWDPYTGGAQMCTVSDLIEREECQRIAQWVWHPKPDDHPVYLCNYHAEPFTASPGMTP